MKVYTDGSGDGRYCFVIPEKIVVKTFKKIGITNNEAEYLAVIEALKYFPDNSRVTVLSDSRLAVNQIKMEWSIKNERLRGLLKQIFDLIEKKKIDFGIEWIPREKNKAGKVLG